MTKWNVEYWVIPPQEDGEFVASIEDVMETYAKPYDPLYPTISMDEQPIQLLKVTRTPILRAVRRLPKACDPRTLKPVANPVAGIYRGAGWRQLLT